MSREVMTAVAIQRQIELIGFASGAGGVDPSCADSPAHLEALGLADTLRARGVRAAWGPTDRACTELANHVAEAIGSARYDA